MSPETNFSNDAIGIVIATSGEVFLSSDGEVRQVKAGDNVYRGEKLVTGSASSAELRFADDSLLSQGAESSISLDDYFYDAADESASELLFKMSQGTFRLVTGKIAEQNPERFQVGTPLATIGIRGTTTVHEILPGGEEKHGVEEIHSGKALLVQSIDGSIRVIDSPQALVDIAASGQLSTVRPMTVQELNSFRDIAPQAIQQEQEIREQDQQDQQDEQEQQSGDDQNEVEQGQDGEQSENGQTEGQEMEGQQDSGEGGETGIQQIAGEGVLEAGVAAIIGDVLDGGLETSIQQAVNDLALGYAEEAFDALNEGDLDTAQELLARLEDIPTEDEILELIEDIADGGDVPEEAEGQTVTSDDGSNWILGTSGDDTWSGTENTDYYKGLAGNDVINGLCGDDFLQGDEGDDIIEGGSGNDSIDGGDGFDFLSFETQAYSSGADVYLGGNSATVAGCSGTDVDSLINIEGVIGSSYGDILSGSSGDNTLLGGMGNDSLSGIAGNNLLNGEDGNDELHGGTGSDTLIGGIGADTLYSGTGNTDFMYLHPVEFNSSEQVVNFSQGDDQFKFDSEFFGTDKHYDTYANYTLSNGTDPVFVWDSSSDKLYWDSDGNGGAAPIVQVANVSGDDVLASDIDLVGLS